MMRTLLRGLLVTTTTLLAMTATSADASAHSARVECNGLEATIVGTPGRDSLVGTPRKDVIVGLSGPDVIKGLGGNDTICGGNGKDDIYGDAGRDFLDGGKGNDSAYGGDDTDHFGTTKGDGHDTYRGGPGSDSFQVKNTGEDRWQGEAGIDFVSILEPSSATVDGGPNRDNFSIQPGASATLLLGGAGDNRLTVLVQPPSPNQSVNITYYGGGQITTSYDDLRTYVAQIHRTYIGVTSSAAFPFTTNFEGSNDADFVAFRSSEGLDQNPGRLIAHANGGDDRLYGGSLDDILDGGDGNDTADGGAGTNMCVGIEQASNCTSPTP
jgi:Ca2+-binding RTX toxin-like protein